MIFDKKYLGGIIKDIASHQFDQFLYFTGSTKAEIAFSKKGDLKFISHLDLMRLLTRALRRADIPVRITQGFNPHPKLSLSRAIKVGLESDHEEARINVRWPVEPKDFLDNVNRALPEGIRVVSASLAKQ